MHLVSQSAFPVEKIVWRPGHGGFAFTVVCKVTFELQPTLSPVAERQEPIVEADEWTETGSLQRATDLVPFKKRPEVLLLGDAYAPNSRPVTSLVTRLVVGEIDKSILVVGDRYVTTDGRIGEPASFVRMPLTWERAVAAQENPVGKQFHQTNHNLSSTASARWLLAPNLYPPSFELPRPGTSRAPVGYAPISPLWPSRLACLQQHAAGWDPLRWFERPLPTNIDLAYMNAAPADQQRKAPFADENLYLENLHPHVARLSTRLALVTPVATVDQTGVPQPLNLRCDTLVIDTNRGLAMLVWRGHVLIDHPDRPGRIVVRCSEKPDFDPASQNDDHDDESGTRTVFANHESPAAALPFTKASSAPLFPPSSPTPAQEPDDTSFDSDGTHTLIPGHFAQSGAILPFSPRPKEKTPTRAEPPPIPPAIEAPARVGLQSWPKLGSDKPITASTPAPVAQPPVVPAIIPETKSAPEPPDTETRLRLIQRAIWKGDRPIQQILADHGLTELEWRAAKRASVRKSSV